jgi:hypothetical protein
MARHGYRINHDGPFFVSGLAMYTKVYCENSIIRPMDIPKREKSMLLYATKEFSKNL